MNPFSDLKSWRLLSFQIFGRPPWLTVSNRSQTYVEKIVATLQATGSAIRLNTPVMKVERTPTGNVLAPELLLKCRWVPLIGGNRSVKRPARGKHKCSASKASTSFPILYKREQKQTLGPSWVVLWALQGHRDWPCLLNTKMLLLVCRGPGDGFPRRGGGV
jgi:hypothetical protein